MNVLVAFKSKEMRDLLSFALESEFCVDVTEVESPEAGVKVLQESGADFDFIVCEYAEIGEKLIRASVTKSLQVHFICEADRQPTDALIYQRKEWIHFITRSKCLEEISGLVRKLFKGVVFDARPVEHQYSRIKTYLLTAITPLSTDLYLRLSDTKHICILRKGDTFDTFDLKYYREKKQVEQLFLKKEEGAGLAEQLKMVLLASKVALATKVEEELSSTDPKRLIAHKIELLKRRARELEAVKEARKQGGNKEDAIAKVAEDAERQRQVDVEKQKEIDQQKADLIRQKAKEILNRQNTAPSPAALKAAAEAKAQAERARLAAAAKAKQDQLVKELEKDLGSILESVQDMGGKLGFSAETQAFTKATVSKTIHSIRQAPKLSMILKELRKDKDKYISSHSMLLAHISCALASKMEWSSDTTYQKLTMAAFLHDITLKNQELAAIGSLKELAAKESQFAADEIKAYKEHPNLGAEIARGFQEVPPDVDQIIMQHHERPDGSGFPRGLNGARIGPLATVFIVAHDLVDFLFQNQVSETLDSLDFNLFVSKHAATYQFSSFRKVLAVLPSIKS